MTEPTAPAHPGNTNPEPSPQEAGKALVEFKRQNLLASLTPEELQAFREALGIPQRQKKRGFRKEVERIRPKVKTSTPEELLQACLLAWPTESETHKEARALFATLYLTGGRVSEVLALTRADYTSKPQPDGSLRGDFTLITEKRGDALPRTVPVTSNDATDREFFRMAVAWINTKTMSEPLFRYSQTRASHVVNEAKLRVTASIPASQTTRALEQGWEFDKNSKTWRHSEWSIHPHYLRHCRLTHLVKHKNFKDSELRAYTGWKSNTMAQVYVDMDADALALKLSN